MLVRVVAGLVAMLGLLTAGAGLVGQAFCDESCTGDEHLLEIGGLAVAAVGLAGSGGGRSRGTAPALALALVAVALLLKGPAGVGLALAIIAAVAAAGAWLLREDPPVH